MDNFYPCRNCNGTMNGQFCEDCGFDELQFVNEMDEYLDEVNQDQEAA